MFGFGKSEDLIIKVFLVWCLGGGLLQWFFEALLFTMLLKPAYEPSVKSLEDFMARNMKLGKCIMAAEANSLLLHKSL